MNPDQFELLTFDCYGTLIDWERGLGEALSLACAAHDVEADEEILLSHFAAVEHTVQAGPFMPYRDVLALTLVGVARRVGFEPSQAQCRAFAASVAHWPPFPDTVEALRRLASRYKVAIVSNVDDDLFAGSQELLEVPFDWVVTAQQVGSYKPAPGHFHEIVRRSGIAKEQILHVAQSLFHDIAPASALGFATLWINRRSGRDGAGATPATDANPNAEVPDMEAAARLLLASQT